MYGRSGTRISLLLGSPTDPPVGGLPPPEPPAGGLGGGSPPTGGSPPKKKAGGLWCGNPPRREGAKDLLCLS